MSDDVGDDEPIPLRDAAQFFFHGRLTKSALRTEARKGNLEIIRIAGKDFVTKNAIRKMIVKCARTSDQHERPADAHTSSKEAVRQRLRQLRKKL
ncbi:hypothetical protein AB3480_06390 [Rhizobium mongolense]|uniref:hypothetical protein n=1 Tax=Rhizobium mongolense TaxID=57676 RepID=UPI0034A24568